MIRTSFLARAVDHIKTHWQQGQSLKQVAVKFGVDAGNLDRAFRKQEGMPAKEFLDRKREERLLLLITDHTRYGHEIGTELGFLNGFAFYRWVRRMFGVSFTELRARARSGFEARANDKK